jgi:hypothetical protein
MNQRCLPMAILGRVRFGAQGAGEIRKMESDDWSSQPSAWMRPQPLV